MDAAGSERAAIMGISEGGPMGILFAAVHPDRTSALILHGVSPKFSASADWEWGWSPDEVRVLLADVEENWGRTPLFDVFAPTLA